MKSKGQRLAEDRRLVRAREKNALKRGLEETNGRMAGRICRNLWGGCKVNNVHEVSE